MDISQAVSDIRGQRRHGQRFLVAIDGFGGSGKSTLAALLAAELGDAAVIAIDDFIVKEHLDDDDWELAWDRQRLLSQVIDRFTRGEQVAHQKLIWESNRLSDPVPMDDAALLIIEGLTSLHPDLVSKYDYRIWVNAPPATARNRGRARDAGSENESRWEAWSQKDEAYRATHRPDRSADTTIEND